VRRAFTSVQLRTILEENHHPFMIVEHRACERARDMAGHVAQAMKQASREATILLYAPAPGSHCRGLRPGLLLLRYAKRARAEAGEKHLGGAGKPDHLGGLLMR